MNIKQKVIKILDKVWFEEIPLDIAYDKIHLLYQKEIEKDKKEMMEEIRKMMRKNGLIDGEKASDIIDDYYNEALRDVLYLLTHKKLDKNGK